jgi:alkylhydroperoxidase/carboxymuconolactone decarboxylase family protein YurZ
VQKLTIKTHEAGLATTKPSTRQATEEGIPDEKLLQVSLLSITTLGFPAAMAAYSWINDIIKK